METQSVLCFCTWIYCGILLFSTFFANAHKCTFPTKWVGHWYQDGAGQIEIKRHHVNKWGHCFSHDGHHKYLLFDKETQCLKCFVFTEQHENLLQYKSSYCDPNPDMSTSGDEMHGVCNDIMGDSQLFTMVREGGTPIPCPMQGDYSFSYVIANGARCAHQESTINACADNSRFLIQQRRCPRVDYSMDKLETFQCLAVWGDGVDKYLYGQFRDPKDPRNSTVTYRCFMYNLYGTRGHMSRSADATCKGLQAPDVGMNVFELTRESRVPHQPCQFPDFVSSTRNWRDLTGTRHLEMLHYGKELRTSVDFTNGTRAAGLSGTQLRAACFEERALEEGGDVSEALYLAHVTDNNCQSTYRCIRFLQRTRNMVEVIIGKSADTTDYACQEQFFHGQEKKIYIPAEMGVVPCPQPGVYNFRHKSRSCEGQLTVGCGSRDSEIVVDTTCAGDGEFVGILQCYATWKQNGHQYLIAGRVGRLSKTADCLVSRVVASGLELTSDPSCGGGQVGIMRFPFTLYLQTPALSCSMTSTPRPEVVNPAQSQVPRDQTGIYDTQRGAKGGHSSAEVIETPPRKTKSEVINKGSHCELNVFLVVVVCLQTTFGLVLSHLSR